MSVVAVLGDEGDAGAELPTFPDVPPLDGLDPAEVSGAVELGAPLVSVAVLGGHAAVSLLGAARVWTVVGGTWQVGALVAAAAVGSVAVGVLAALVLGVVWDGAAAREVEATRLCFFAARRRWFGAAGPLGTGAADDSACCTGAGAAEDSGAATAAATVPPTDVPCPTLSSGLAW